MCIAIYSPKGNDVPCEEYLRNSFLYNPDGAGFAYNTNKNNVKIEKGFMTFNDFYKAFKKADSKYNFKNRGVLIHFRITTHGGTNEECCHPFPLVSDVRIMKKTRVSCDYAVIHNGIIHLTDQDTFGREKVSDTMAFIEKYLSKIATNKKWFKNKTNFELIYDLIDSKMAVLNGYGEIMSTAGFVKDADGNYYSNTSYKEARVRYTKCYDWSGYGDIGSALDERAYWSNGAWHVPGVETSETKTDNKREDDFKSVTVELMKLRAYESLIMDDGEIESYDPDYPLYLTEDHEVYLGTARECDKNGVDSLEFLGYGEIYDWNAYLAVPFRNDIEIPLELLWKDFRS